MFAAPKQNFSTLDKDEAVLRKIETVCLGVIQSVALGKPPQLLIPRRSSWSDLRFEETVCMHTSSEDIPVTKVKFESPQSVKKFATMLKILRIIYTLVQENKFCTKRDIYYQYPDLYPSQSSIDRIIDDIACMLSVPRWELHILATSKGLVAGDLQFENAEGTFIDCGNTTVGVQIAAHIKDMQNLQTSASFVLVVEKDATFQKLMSCQFCQKMQPCILITGKGFPDIGTRLLLRQLWLTHRLPMFTLVDADPHGIEIMAVYKFGSMNQASETKHLAVPSVEWIGVLPEDIQRLRIPSSVLSPLSEKDLQKCKALKRRPYFREDLKMLCQIELLLEIRMKAEIQCLDTISSSYLCDVYLPSRIGLGMEQTYSRLDGISLTFPE